MAKFTASNTGIHHGADVSQHCLTNPLEQGRMRLVGFQRAAANPARWCSQPVLACSPTSVLAHRGGAHAVAPGKFASDLTLIAAGFSPKGKSETELQRVAGSCHKSATTMRLCSIC